jgi:hypothetical protein
MVVWPILKLILFQINDDDEIERQKVGEDK